MTATAERTLKLNYSGRILDHLGLQMYQSPVAAVAELVSNAWDADAENVSITLPNGLGPDAVIKIRDDGDGMDFDACQARFLNVGFARRGNNPTELSSGKKRKILGRKGIGKFAGFGIADVIQIETVSRNTGERTVFEMDILKLRMGDYVNESGGDVDVVNYQAPDDTRAKSSHGTTVTLRNLKLQNRREPGPFARSMARRFLIHQLTQDFKVTVNGLLLPETEEVRPIQFSFPRDYRPSERPEGLKIEKDWGVEPLPGGQTIRWRVNFYEDTIGDDELRGISVFSGGKLVQAPFFFNLSGGLPGQHGQQYIAGQVLADYLDEQKEDLISPERQRVNWEDVASGPLHRWGQSRVRQLLGLWRARRGEERERQLQDRIAGFSARLLKLEQHEQRTVSQALRRLAQIETLTQRQFNDLGEALLTAWEQGRLRDLIDDISESDNLDAEDLITILAEAQVLTALNTAEAVKTKLQAVAGLQRRVQKRELENAVRDYISGQPWLISPGWDTFRVETSLARLLDAARKDAGLTKPDMAGRVDLALSSGGHLLVIEFMRPGLRVDWDHISRFERYVITVRSGIKGNTGSPFRIVSGVLIADSLARSADVLEKIQYLEQQDMLAMDWDTLFGRALSQWKEFLTILASRAPEDQRLQSLLPAENGLQGSSSDA